MVTPRNHPGSRADAGTEMFSEAICTYAMSVPPGETVKAARIRSPRWIKDDRDGPCAAGRETLKRRWMRSPASNDDMRIAAAPRRRPAAQMWANNYLSVIIVMTQRQAPAVTAHTEVA